MSQRRPAQAIKETGNPISGSAGQSLRPDTSLFGRLIPLPEGSLVLRDASGVVADSLNYGGLSDPWAAKGYQAESGEKRVAASLLRQAGWRFSQMGRRFARSIEALAASPDGADTDSTVRILLWPPLPYYRSGPPQGAQRSEVASVAGFRAGRDGTRSAPALMASAGWLPAWERQGRRPTSNEVPAGATTIPVGSPLGFENGQTITVGTGADAETGPSRRSGASREERSSVAAPLKQAHGAGTQVSGTGLTLGSGLTRAHAVGAQVGVTLPTPGTPNESEQVSPASARRVRKACRF